MTMDFVTAVKTCLTQKYASFQGRASRSEYWWFFLAIFIGAVITQLIGWVVYMIYALALICPTLAAGFRRLQDTGRPGWYIVIPFAFSLVLTLLAPAPPDPDAIAGGSLPNMTNFAIFGVLGLIQLAISILFLWWLTRPSQPEINAYGPPPVPAT